MKIKLVLSPHKYYHKNWLLSLHILYAGVATAFAARDILGNVLSGLSMQFSKPFSLGDTIKVCSTLSLLLKTVFSSIWAISQIEPSLFNSSIMKLTGTIFHHLHLIWLCRKDVWMKFPDTKFSSFFFFVFFSFSHYSLMSLFFIYQSVKHLLSVLT